jgi:hypothetical protein
MYFRGERYRNNEAIEETAFVSMSNFATGVTVASAWLSRRSNALRERIEAADVRPVPHGPCIDAMQFSSEMSMNDLLSESEVGWHLHKVTLSCSFHRPSSMQPLP